MYTLDMNPELAFKSLRSFSRSWDGAFLTFAVGSFPVACLVTLLGPLPEAQPLYSRLLVAAGASLIVGLLAAGYRRIGEPVQLWNQGDNPS